MEKEILTFLEEFTAKTGIDFSCYDSDGEKVFGNGDGEDVTGLSFEGVLTDVKKDRTLFHIKIKNAEFIGEIRGAGSAGKNYAYLLSALIERTFGKNASLSREEFYRALILGELALSDVGKYMRKYSVGDGACSAMIIVSDRDNAGVRDAVDAYVEDKKDFTVRLDERSFVLVKFIESAAGDYRSFAEYAEYIAGSIYEELGISVFIALGGTVKSLSDIPSSFSQAATTQRMAEASGLKTGVHSFKQYILYKILEDLPKHKLSEYMELLGDPGAENIFSDKEMVETAEEFLENSLNQSETARKLYLHRNTLTYRLDKIEKATGLNIRTFSDAVTFRLITVIRELVK